MTILGALEAYRRLIEWCSHGITASYGFKCEERMGAIVIPGDHGALRVVRPNNIFFEYVRKHHRSWYDLAQTIGLAVRPDDLILVSGWLKTTDWVVATVLTEERSRGFSLSIDSVSSPVQASFNIERATHRSFSAHQRRGPNRVAERRHNQCLFIRYYKAKYRVPHMSWLGMKIVAAAEPQDLREEDDAEGHSAGTLDLSSEQGVPELCMQCLPAIIEKYWLMKPGTYSRLGRCRRPMW